MATPDLPIYGQVLAYGLGFGAAAFGLRQCVRAIRELTDWLMTFRRK